MPIAKYFEIVGKISDVTRMVWSQTQPLKLATLILANRGREIHLRRGRLRRQTRDCRLCRCLLHPPPHSRRSQSYAVDFFETRQQKARHRGEPQPCAGRNAGHRSVQPEIERTVAPFDGLVTIFTGAPGPNQSTRLIEGSVSVCDRGRNHSVFTRRHGIRSVLFLRIEPAAAILAGPLPELLRAL